MGLAVSDPTRLVARSLPSLRVVGRRKDLDALEGIVGEWEVREIVVGWPRNLDGSAGEMTGVAVKLAEDLRERTGLPVELWDERLSTAQAERALLDAGVRRDDRRRLRDGVAATIILQGFLDSRSFEGSS